MKNGSIKNSCCLLLTAFVWGVAFVAQSVGMDYMGPFSFNGGRSLLGCLVLLPLVCYRRRKAWREGVQLPEGKITWIGGISCGLVLCAASLCQQIGIQYTTVGKAGFITALYIVIVPIMGIFLKKRVQGKVWIAAVVAAVGMYLLCMRERLVLSRGDTWVFVCAVLFSVHILVIDYFSPKADGVEISCIQFLTAGVICSLGALILEKPTPEVFLAGIVPLAYAGIMSSGVGYTLQIVGQKNMNPTVASLILSLESVFSALAGWVILRQILSPRELLGCVLVFGAVILVQLPDKRPQKEENDG